ncbi:MAG: carboxypeptidase regulatory-like domain-containing protein [Planctomycetota bacterium]
MKRALILGSLVICTVAVAALLLYRPGERAGRRGVSIGEEGGRSEARSGEAGTDRLSPGGADGIGREINDDDPNRISGPPVTIRGIVLKEEAPARDASVALFRSRPRNRPPISSSFWSMTQTAPVEIVRARCDDDGRFAFTLPRRSALMVFASAPGAAFAWMALLLPKEGDPEEIVLRLGEGASLSGVVVDADRVPVSGVPVTVTQSDNRRTRYTESTSTSELGTFRFDNLAPGSYFVLVQPEAHPPQARSVTLPRTQEVLFELVEGGSVAGRVSNDRGEAIAGAEILLRGRHEYTLVTGLYTAVSDTEGHYRVAHALAGPIQTVLVQHTEYGIHGSDQGDLYPPQELVRKGEELRFDIELPAGVPVRGIVVFEESGKPVPSARVNLLRLGKTYANLRTVHTTEADGEGKFEFPHVAEGTYALEATSDLAARLPIRSAGRGRPVTMDFFTDGVSPPKEQRIELAGTGGVRGAIVGLEPSQMTRTGVQVTVADVTRYGAVDDFGFYEILHVPPTDDTVVQAWRPQMKSEPFAVRAGETVEVELSASAEGGLGGVVLDEDRIPIPRARVMAVRESRVKNEIASLLGGGDWRSRTTDSEGRFVLPVQGDAEAKWVVLAIHDEYDFAMSEAVTAPEEGETTDLTIELVRSGTMSGIVEHEGGGPAANVLVYSSPKREKGVPFETRPRRTVTTGIDGLFEMTGIGLGAYTVSAWSPEGSVESLEAQAGEDDLRLLIRPSKYIGGLIVDEDGAPISRARVYAIVPGAKGEAKRYGAFGQSGRFRISNLEEGSYPIEVAPNTQNRWGASTVSFDVERSPPVPTGTDNLVITVSYGPEIRGRVLGPGNKPLGGVTVLAMALRAPKQEKKGSQPDVPRAITNGAGEFKLRGVGEKEVELLAGGAGYMPTAMRATPGEGPVTIHMEKGEVIEGRILKPDGTPLQRHWFSISPLSKDVQARVNSWMSRGVQNVVYGSWGYAGKRTDSSGRFVVDGLWPGEYRLYVRTPDSVAPGTGFQTGTGAVLVQMVASLKIRGRMVDTQGNPVASKGGNQLYVSARRGEKWLQGGRVGEDGTFEIRALTAGKVTLHCWGNRYYKAATVEAVAGDVGVTIVIERR